MKLSKQYVFAHSVTEGPESVFGATISAHGLYNTQQFVLRLSPVIHEKLAAVSSGQPRNKEVGFEGAQAMSTYLHETIHWWQHVGSTYGFVYGLNYPVQSHCTHGDLQRLVEEDGFKKSIALQAEQLNLGSQTGFGTPAGRASTIINNHFDLLAFRAFTLGPDAARSVIEQRLFESVGHAFHMTYGHTLNIMASTVDLQHKFIPDPRQWSQEYGELKEKKARGFYYGSPIALWPLGAYEIFEGQARFSQIQYLSHASGDRMTWEDFRGIGMLSGVYVKAFERFLDLAEASWPSDVNNPLVGLFLLVCDLAINPGRGFPFSVSGNCRTFIDDVNPGARFCMYSRLIARDCSELKDAITEYDRSEYEEVTGILSIAAKQIPPLSIAKVFSEWFSDRGLLKGLRHEYEDYQFGPVNYVIRHLLAHFLAFQQDKYQRPEFFCWPGAWLAGKRFAADEKLMFEKHGALFVDRADDDGVFPRIQLGRTESAVDRTFNDFYHNAVTYDLTNQWIAKKGAFEYDVAWLASSASKEEAETYMRRQFESAFDLDPCDAEILL